VIDDIFQASQSACEPYSSADDNSTLSLPALPPFLPIYMTTMTPPPYNSWFIPYVHDQLQLAPTDLCGSSRINIDATTPSRNPEDRDRRSSRNRLRPFAFHITGHSNTITEVNGKDASNHRMMSS